MVLKNLYIYWNHLVGRMLHVFGKYAGFVDEYTEILGKKKTAWFPNNRLK